MSAKKDIQTSLQSEPVTPAQRIRADWKALVEKVSFKGIVGNVPYLFFLVILCLIYIANTHRAVEVQRELNKANETIKELHWQHTDIQTRLMNAGTETEIIRNGTKIGLKPLALPAYSIIDSSGKTK